MMIISANGMFGFMSSHTVTYLSFSELMRSKTGYEVLSYRLGTIAIGNVILKSIVWAE